MAQPTARGPVDIMGVTTRSNHSEERRCVSELCFHEQRRITMGRPYERVARLNGSIEFYHPKCFVEEFGDRAAYGD